MTKPIFLDCGYHQGQGLRQFTAKLGVDDSWDVYAYETNPACHRYFPDFCRNGWHYSPKAVWTRPEILLFRQEAWKDSKSGSPIVESDNEFDGWGSTVMLDNQHPGLCRTCQVPAFDLSRVLRFLAGREVHVKLDVEGAEYPILRHLLANRTISIIKHLYVEFHYRLLPQETEISTIALLQECQKHTEVSLHE